MTRFTFLVIITMITLAGVSLAREVKSQGMDDVKVTLSFKGAKLDQILDDLERQSGFSFAYPQEIGKLGPFSISVKSGTLLNTLQKLAFGNRLSFKPSGNLISVSQLPKPPKPGKISGKILNDKGETLPGASLRVIETGAGAQAAADGSYILSLQPGTYTLEISYMSFATQRITGVAVIEGKNTPLDISLKPDTKGLQEVVVTASYRKASVEGLLARQKNASEISNGISAEQIARTPDRNIGESLKRISGVSTIDNKFVIVRGIGERYNSAMLDGVILPSTEAQTRNFSFDLIPSNLVDNVVVSKTVTPDMNASFGGGLIQINTKDIPNENFMSFTAGTSYNDQSTGKDFLSHKRGKYDYLGFDDGRRDYPEGLQHTTRNVEPNITLTNAEYQKKIDDQSKRFTNDNFTLYKYKAAPSQNYQFTIGHLFALDTVNKNKLGFTGALSYRNTQSINLFDQQRRSDWNQNFSNYGANYGFNTTLAGLLNVGLQLGTSRFSFRNTYTRLYDNTLVRTIGYDSDNGTGDLSNGVPPNRIIEADDPTYTTLLQNKLSGQHQLGKVKIEWDVAKTLINREEKDLTIATQGILPIGNDYQYFYYPGISSEPNFKPASRHHYKNKENYYSWNLSSTLPFKTFSIKNTAKTGYYGIFKKGGFDWQIASFTSNSSLPDSLRYIPIGEMIKPEHIGANGFTYSITPFFLDSYKGKSQTHAGYVMFDSRFLENLRLVWGLRLENYKYTEITNGFSIKGGNDVFELKKDKAWQWLPSANLTYSPWQQVNIRAAISSSVVRPELMDNSKFFRYSPYLDAQLGSSGLYSTRINSYDIKAEWFPGSGEIISAGGFYKNFNRPAELTFILVNGNINYYLQNADHAKVYGFEFELRKNLGIISESNFFKNITAYGNLTLQKSDVIAAYKVPNSDVTQPTLLVQSKQRRPMYGQSPYLVNAGLQYLGNHLGLNVMYNKSGYKTYVVSVLSDNIEYEKPREQIDAQVSYRFLKKKMEFKVNFGNLLNRVSVFYVNTGSYENNPDYDPSAINKDVGNAIRLKPGFTNQYEDGDQVRFSQKFGRTYSTSITYNF